MSNEDGNPITWGELRTTLQRLTRIETEGHKVIAAQFDGITREMNKINNKLDATTKLLRGADDDSDNPGLLTRVTLMEREFAHQETEISKLRGYALMLGCGIVATLGGLAITLVSQFLGKP